MKTHPSVLHTSWTTPAVSLTTVQSASTKTVRVDKDRPRDIRVDVVLPPLDPRPVLPDTRVELHSEERVRVNPPDVVPLLVPARRNVVADDKRVGRTVPVALARRRRNDLCRGFVRAVVCPERELLHRPVLLVDAEHRPVHPRRLEVEVGERAVSNEQSPSKPSCC